MSKQVLNTLESIRRFMHKVNRMEDDVDEKGVAEDYFEKTFCVPVCRNGNDNNPKAFRSISNTNSCDGCFFGSISSNAVDRKVDQAIEVIKLMNIMEDSDAG